MLTMEKILNIVPAWRKITSDTQLMKDPVYIDKVWIESKNGEITTLYDGVGTAGKGFIIRHTTTNKLAQVDLGLLFNDGLYVDVSSEMDQMYIKYRPLPG